MSKWVRKAKQNRKEMYTNILTDQYLLPESKVLLMYLFEMKGGWENAHVTVVDEEVIKELNFSKYKWNRARKQLKELELIGG